jgi:hypothetical protein
VAAHQGRKDVVFWDLIAVIDPFSQTERALPSERELIDRLKCIHRPVLKIGTSRRYCEWVEALKKHVRCRLSGKVGCNGGKPRYDTPFLSLADLSSILCLRSKAPTCSRRRWVQP